MISFSYFPKPESSSFVGETSFLESDLRIFALVAALLSNAVAIAQDYRGTAEPRAAAHLTPSGFAPTTFLMRPKLKAA